MSSSRRFEVTVETPLPLVWERLCDRRVSEARTEVGGATAQLTAHEPPEGPEDPLVVGISTGIPESWLPAMVRQRAPALPTVHRTETWYRRVDGIDGTMALRIDGVPATASGRMHGVPAGTSTRLRYDIDLTVSMPVVAKAVEQTVLVKIEGVLGKEADALGRG